MSSTADLASSLSALLDAGSPPDPRRADGPTPCQVHDPDLWFAEQPDAVARAKALCRPCPLRQACLTGALEREEPWGVWGGQLVVNGKVVAHKRGRGRPRKNPTAA